MPIHPLPQFEEDLKADQEAYAKLEAPKTVVVRFGATKMIGEFPFDLDVKPGCGTKMVVRTARGTELSEMLTSTCPNSGCSKSVSRQEMLEYIENSGGRDYPYFTDGKVLRIATVEDMNKQSAMEAGKIELIRFAREVAQRLDMPMKVVDAEEILGGERLTFYFASEERIDFRPMVMELAARYRTRIEMRQVGARDEARLTADYEKCGQHCCCKQFLKVLKPVSMKQAKIQKATLDPLKISGRCGRLMCCLRYEESTYDDLRKRLPKKKTRVTTPDGPGLVIDTQILTQLVLVELESNGERSAYPVESLDGGAAVTPTKGEEYDEEDDGPRGEAGPLGDRPPPRSPPPPPQPPSPANRPGGAPGGAPGGPRPDRPRNDRPRNDRGPRPSGPPNRGGPGGGSGGGGGPRRDDRGRR